MDEHREAAIAYLKKDKLLHMDMLEALKQGEADLLHVSARGVLLRTRETGTLLLASDNAQEAARWLREEGVSPELEELSSIAQRERWEDAEEPPEMLPSRAKLMAIHGDGLARSLMDQLDLSLCITCRPAVYRKTKKPGKRRGATVHYEVRPLDESYLGLVQEFYAPVGDGNIGYLPERLARGQVYGAFYRAELMGFIGEAAEGSLGMLEILPAYRRKGVDQELCRWLALRQMERGRVPFAQVEPHNAISLAAHSKLGYEIADEMVHWVEIPSAM